MTKVAFIGLGSMGAPLARRIAEGPFELAVYDPFPAALQAFEGKARLANSPQDAADNVDIASICVRDDKQVEDVLFGENGLAAGLKPGSLVLVHSTVSVDTIHKVSDILAGQDIAVIDAPVSRTRRTEDEPFVYSMLGGDAASFERARPLLGTFSTDIGHMGPLGAGLATKVANNMVTWVQVVAGVQGVVLAARNGVDVEKLIDVMRSNGNLTPTMGAILGGKFQAPWDKAREELFISQGGIGAKDLALALETAGDVGLETGVIREAQALVQDIMGTQPKLD